MLLSYKPGFRQGPLIPMFKIRMHASMTRHILSEEISPMVRALKLSVLCDPTIGRNTPPMGQRMGTFVQ